MGCAPSRNIVRPQAFDVVTVPSPAPTGFGMSKKKSNALHPEPFSAVPASTPGADAGSVQAPSTISAPSSASTGSMGPSMELLPTVNHRLDRLSYEELGVQFLKAVKAGDVAGMECVEAHVTRTKHPSLIDIRGMWESTPLIYACQYAHPATAKWLLERNADINLQNEKGVTPLLLASLEGMTEAVVCILRIMNGASSRPTTTLSPSQSETFLVVEEPGTVVTPSMSVDKQIGVVYNSQTDLNVRVNPLLAASMNGHAEIVERLITEGQASVDVGVGLSATISSPKQFALLLAAKYGYGDVVRQLMVHGADPTNCDGNENHALLLCCEANKQECALQLLRIIQENEVGQADTVSIWKAPNCHGFTALHFAALHGLVTVCEVMLRDLHWQSDKAFVNHVTSTRSECAVLMACRKKNWEVVELLIACGADVQLADRGGTRALQVLQRESKENLLRLCVDQNVVSRPKPTGGEAPVPAAEPINEPREEKLKKTDAEATMVLEPPVDNLEATETVETDVRPVPTLFEPPVLPLVSVQIPEVPTLMFVPDSSSQRAPDTILREHSSFDERNDSVVVPVVLAPVVELAPMLDIQAPMSDTFTTMRPTGIEKGMKATDRLISFAPNARMVDSQEEIVTPLVPSLSLELELEPMIVPHRTLVPALELKASAPDSNSSAPSLATDSANGSNSRFSSRRMGPTLTALPVRPEEHKLPVLPLPEESVALATEEQPSSSSKKTHHSRRNTSDPDPLPSGSPTRRSKKKHHKKKAKAGDSPVKDSSVETLT